MSLTTDPKDPRLTRGIDVEPTKQADVYLVLSEEERAKGFVRPVRDTYVHVGPDGPRHPTRDLTEEEHAQYDDVGYVQFEDYPKGTSSVVGRFWTQAQLDAAGNGCRTATTMGPALAETYARNPAFYGATYCVGCRKHLPVAEFVWRESDGSRVGS